MTIYNERVNNAKTTSTHQTHNNTKHQHGDAADVYKKWTLVVMLSLLFVGFVVVVRFSFPCSVVYFGPFVFCAIVFVFVVMLFRRCCCCFLVAVGFVCSRARCLCRVEYSIFRPVLYVIHVGVVCCFCCHDVHALWIRYRTHSAKSYNMTQTTTMHTTAHHQTWQTRTTGQQRTWQTHHVRTWNQMTINMLGNETHDSTRQQRGTESSSTQQAQWYEHAIWKHNSNSTKNKRAKIYNGTGERKPNNDNKSNKQQR